MLRCLGLNKLKTCVSMMLTFLMCIRHAIRRHLVSDGNQGGPSLKDPLQVPDGLITRSKK